MSSESARARKRVYDQSRRETEGQTLSVYEEYMTRLMMDAAKKQTILARDMNYLMASDIGESFRTLINELLAKLKDEHVFAEDDSQRLEIKGSIIAIQTLLSVILEFAHNHELEKQPGWKEAMPAWASDKPEGE